MSKLSVAVAGGIGFLAGSRAGRGPYEQAMTRAKNLCDDPQVRRSVADAKGVTLDKAGDVVQAATTKVGHLGSGSEAATS